MKSVAPGKEGRAQAEDDTVPEATLLAASASELRKHLERDREEAAEALLSVLKKRQVKTAKSAEKLMRVLHEAEDLAVSGPDLLRYTEAAFKREGSLKNTSLANLGEEALHSLRKAAKQARYLAETLPKDAALAAAAQRFEAIQDAGGQWHDALEIARASRRHFGKGHPLTSAYRDMREEKLAAFQDLLAQNLKPRKRSAKSAESVAGAAGTGKKEPSRAARGAAKRVSTAA